MDSKRAIGQSRVQGGQGQGIVEDEGQDSIQQEMIEDYQVHSRVQGDRGIVEEEAGLCPANNDSRQSRFKTISIHLMQCNVKSYFTINNNLCNLEKKEMSRNVKGQCSIDGSVHNIYLIFQESISTSIPVNNASKKLLQRSWVVSRCRRSYV
jgi:hypothetical protein